MMRRSDHTAMRPTIRLTVTAALLAITAGCGGGSDLTPVRGAVEFDGKPLTEFDHAAVVFTPRAGRLATSVIGPDGTFQLTTIGVGDGAAAGAAGVSVSATVEAPSSDPRERHAGVRWVIPEKFASPDSSTLACDVLPGKDNFFRIVLSSDGTGSISSD